MQDLVGQICVFFCFLGVINPSLFCTVSTVLFSLFLQYKIQVYGFLENPPPPPTIYHTKSEKGEVG